ncbi:hypothetical protein [Thermomonospora catenispora]|uniref:WXG100-like domain-containing protein n=1 Tax=Thermomonospora catenispora TaxID=2493090 RepID=UPI00112248AF|nr:hypothetical protein [Thermomonospora catenispora]TNY36683.1 hypothetical protein EIO00_11525 [Thermomonospora catenispora]
MGLQLPGELVSLLSMLGYTWPEADEGKLFQLGSQWMGFSGTLNEIAAAAEEAARKVPSVNTGADIAAFQSAWSAEDAPLPVLRKASIGALAVGGCFLFCAGVVLALKIGVIVQLVILAIQIAQAIATAPATFGASLLEIPVFKMITGMIIDFLIDQAIGALLG